MTRRKMQGLLVSMAVVASVGCFAIVPRQQSGEWPAAGTAWATWLPDSERIGSPEPRVDINVGSPAARTIYVSCRGDDGNAGTMSAPLRTVSAATRRPLPAGTTIALARGCTWVAPVELRGDGTVKQPIVLTAYGAGTEPVVTGAAAIGLTGALRLLGDYQVVQHVHVTDAKGTGIEIRGSHGTVRDVQIDQVGIGVLFAGPAGSAVNALVRDLHMVVNTVGGDDDYGAIGFNVQAPDVEIARSSCVNCRARSHDYGYDGGFAEVWNFGDGLNIHDSLGQNTDGILEIGGNQPAASARRITVRDNTFDPAHGGIVIHDGDRFGIAVPSLAVSGNTIVNTAASDNPILSGQIRDVRFDYNVVSTRGLVSASGPPASHRCNVYHLDGAGRVGFELGATERFTHAVALPSCER